MASSSAPVHPARYLTLFLVLLVGVFLLVFLTGDKQAKPKLGIDLQGGTRVTLTARTPDGSAPTREALNQAQQIISARVNGLGVSGSEVIIDGSNLVITVPGNDSSEARNLGQTARLYIRPVIHVIPAQGQAQQPPADAPPGAPPGGAEAHPACRPSPLRQPGAPVSPPAEQAPPPAAPAPPRRPRHRSRGPIRRNRRRRRPHRRRPDPALRPRPGAPPPAEKQTLAQRIADEKQLRQSAEQQIQILALQFQATRCNEEDVLAGNDDPNLPLVTCSQDGKQVYLLDKSIIKRRADQERRFRTRPAARRVRRRPWSSTMRRRGSGPTSPRPTSAPRPPSCSTRKVVSAPADPGGHPRRAHPDHRPVHRRLRK